MGKVRLLVAMLLLSTSIQAQDTSKKIHPVWVPPEKAFNKSSLHLSSDEQASIASDRQILDSFIVDNNMSTSDMKRLLDNTKANIKVFVAKRDSLIKNGGSQEAIQSKNDAIKSLSREVRIMELSMLDEKLAEEAGVLITDRMKLKRYLTWAGTGLVIVVLVVTILSLRYRIRMKNAKIYQQLKAISEKNVYLEYAAKIIRHDMHSGINTYLPRGVNALERKLPQSAIVEYKLEAPLKLIKDGLAHSQKVYKGVYEFTNLVKKNAILEKEPCDLKVILYDYLAGTPYINQVKIENLPTIHVNKSLFCTAIDNLIRNGLKYNDSASKMIRIYQEGNFLVVHDNGRGMDESEFKHLSQPYVRKEGQNESGSGLGLNICMSILNEHKFKVLCKKDKGTKFMIKVM